MTNKELLQQCKEEVAKEKGYGSWDNALLTLKEFWHVEDRVDELATLAAEKAMQKAREEVAELASKALLTLADEFTRRSTVDKN